MMIRQATVEDVPQVMTLYTAMRREIYRPGDERLERVKDERSMDELVRRPDVLVMVVEHTQRIVGMMIVAVCSELSRGVAIYLAPEVRRGWLAQRLVRDGVAWARAHGARYIDIRTNKGSVAQRLLSRLGWEVVGVEMRKELANA